MNFYCLLNRKFELSPKGKIGINVNTNEHLTIIISTIKLFNIKYGGFTLNLDLMGKEDRISAFQKAFKCNYDSLEKEFKIGWITKNFVFFFYFVT